MRKAMLGVALALGLGACVHPRPVYVDVRTPAEYAAGHVTGAINIPYDQMPQRWTELDSLRSKPVVLYCRSGHRAGIALAELQTHGFTHAVNGGGMSGLMTKGVPVTSAGPAAPAAPAAPAPPAAPGQ